MPLERNGKEYLNNEESYTLLGISYLTFRRVEEDYGLEAKTFLGQQRQKFYLKDALLLIKDTPRDEATVARIKVQIIELQKGS